MSTREIPKNVLLLLHKKFNIIDHLTFMEFDRDYDVLKRRLAAVARAEFDARDKIIVEHFDTDFYLPEMSVGVTMKNFFTLVTAADIPLNVFVFYTNHFGISKELDVLCKHHNTKCQPIVLESLISKSHYPDSGFKESPANFDKISCSAVSMIHGFRSHRHAFYNHICHVGKDKLAIKFTPVQ